MNKRDVELSRFLVECQKRDGSPRSVYFCGSKNTPDRVAEITRIFHDAGLMSCQSVALQTMNPETLARVERENIKTSAYIQLQKSLNERGIDSFVEIIWPLPGETLSSFQQGLAALCEVGADSFVIYPLLLMNNVELRTKREEFGLVTVRDPDPNSEAEIVVQTADVDVAAYRDGLRYVYAVTSLYCLRGLWCLGRHLNARGIMDYGSLFRSFAAYCRQRPEHPFTAFCEDSIRSLDTVTFSNIGALVHLILHSERQAFDELMRDFLASQEIWRDPVVQLLFEVDLVSRPYIYRNTPIGEKAHEFVHLRVDTRADGYAVEIPAPYLPSLREHLGLHGDDSSSSRFEVIHRRTQLPFMRSKALHENFIYCQDTIQRMGRVMPVWRGAAPPAAMPS
jgi:putative methyltransferase